MIYIGVDRLARVGWSRASGDRRAMTVASERWISFELQGPECTAPIVREYEFRNGVRRFEAMGLRCDYCGTSHRLTGELVD